jgi:N-acetyl-gamma-glutamyl-phosphate reductase
LIANPGCYPTAVQLGFKPLVSAGLVDCGSLIADAKSGVSGAGRKAETHILFSEASDNFKAYGVSGHRHLPEIRQGLANMAGASVGSDLRSAFDADDSWHSCDALCKDSGGG